ncbi:MAG TPA: PepSY domain-containing protein [Methylocystis sp.]|nr:PepSY domain-containing protein [Methylocystis sp.]
MAFLDFVLRRDTARAEPGAQAAPASAKEKRKQHNAGFYYWSFFIHKWAGLIGLAWLAVLGLTGFFLDHDSWRWLQQGKAPAFLTPAALDANSARGVARLLQFDPNDRAAEVAGGPRGLWRTNDGGASWTATRFTDGDHPQILAIEPDPAQGFGTLWLGTDNGVYVSRDGGATAQPASLKGEYVTWLAAGATAKEMIAVVDRSTLMRFDTDTPAAAERVELGPLGRDAAPTFVQLNRFARELHFGKGVFDATSSLVMNDVGGLAMFVLSLTGLLYWALPKYWKHRAKTHGAVSKETKAARRSIIVWLFRFHSPTIGLASLLMLLYLSITGILIGHSRELGDWMRATHLPQAVLTPAFGGGAWSGAIDSVVAYPDRPGAFTIGNRLGMFTTQDNGRSWTREENRNGLFVPSASRLRRIGDKILLAGGMAGPSFIRGADNIDREVSVSDRGHDHGGGHHRHGDGAGGDQQRRGGRGEGMRNGDAAAARVATDAFGGMNGMEGMFMPSDVTRLGDNYVWKSSGKAYVTDADGREIENFDIKQPQDPGTPWFSWLLRVHMGTIFWSEWRWVNDVFAVLAVFLSVTGAIRWWRQKWM